MNSTRAKKIKTDPTPRFYKDLKKIPSALRQIIWGKLTIFEENPHHSSLRVKKMHSHKNIWELSITKEYGATFQWTEYQSGERTAIAILRRVGTHDILKAP